MLAALRRRAPEPEIGARLPRPLYGDMAARVEAVCYRHAGGGADWYPSLMIGINQIHEVITARNTQESALALLDKLTGDDYSDYLRAFYHEGLERFGETWNYADIVTALLGLGALLQPKRYLEIGVRRGRSAAAVASVAPACDFCLFDRWTANYAGIDNPGPEFVQEELARLGHHGDREFVNGDSHKTLPAFFEKHPDIAFDLITVDGDHSAEGAARDLADVLPHLAIGGAVVFDDICHPKHPELRTVWNRLVVDDQRFATTAYDGAGYGVACALRKY
jgi:predicted O-methyltransferase YrrM